MTTETKQRFEVREATGPAWDWLPDWLVIDTEREVRAAAYDDENAAREHCDELNQEAAQ